MWGLGVLIPLLGAGALRVLQAPGEVQVTAGDTVALRCLVEVDEHWDQLRMEWVRDGGHGVLCATRLDPLTPEPHDPCAHPFHLTWQPPWATLSLPPARGNDSRRYLCRVTLEI
ncbi:TMIG2 protein, partial [Neopipo cinnamomea]|nr:TMIG2 protein [Neopipo cinnamomea]